MFLNPGICRSKFAILRETGQAYRKPGEIVRCILESLALKYRYVLERTEQLSETVIKGLHIVGGGIQNELLCQLTSNAIGKPVWAGPVEGSAIGNMIVQWIAPGELADIWEARKVIRDSFAVSITSRRSSKHGRTLTAGLHR